MRNLGQEGLKLSLKVSLLNVLKDVSLKTLCTYEHFVILKGSSKIVTNFF